MAPTRRDILKAGGAVVSCGCAGIGVSGCAMFSGISSTPTAPPEAARLVEGKLVVDFARVPALAAVGGAVKLATPDGKNMVFIVRSGDTQFAAFVNRCTHGGRELEYQHEQRKLRCVSFGHSLFDLQGRRLGGPAKGDLTVLAITRTSDSLEIAL